MNQADLEKYVGIDSALAWHLNNHGDRPEFKVVRDLLAIQVKGLDPAGLAMLKESVIRANKHI